MMYNNKLAIAIKVNGKVLREFGDQVYVPFGSEYTILVKNLNTTRVLVNITIDGTSATKNGLVIDANKEVELERFLKEDLNQGNKFKFIERTGDIENHRGIKIDDGLVVVDYQFELPKVDYYNPYPFTKLTNYDWTITSNNYYNGNLIRSNSPLKGSSISSGRIGSSGGGTYSYNTTSTINAFKNEAGITVPGGLSEQKFSTTYIGLLETTKHNMVIKLLGETDDSKPISKPITTNIKPKCVTCGKINKATSKFCNKCGTALEIIA